MSPFLSLCKSNRTRTFAHEASRGCCMSTLLLSSCLLPGARLPHPLHLSPSFCLPFSDSGLRPVAVVFIELFLLLVHTTGIHVCIMADVERSNNTVIGSWP